jgi:hypothetical protein
MDTSLAQKWRVLGVAFEVFAEVSVEVEQNLTVDLEKTIVESLSAMYADKKFLTLIVAWLGSFGDLVNVRRLLVVLKKCSLPEEEWRVLGGLVRSRLAQGDRRYSRVEFLILRKIDKKWREPPDWMDEFHALRRGKDAAFSFFGLTLACPGKLDGQFGRKLLQREHVLNNNSWLQMRAHLGSIPFADAFFWSNHFGGDTTASEIAAHALCSLGTAAAALKAVRMKQSVNVVAFLAELNSKLGFTEMALAKRLGTSQPAISAILNGRRKVGRKMASHILRISPTLFDEATARKTV